MGGICEIGKICKIVGIGEICWISKNGGGAAAMLLHQHVLIVGRIGLEWWDMWD